MKDERISDYLDHKNIYQFFVVLLIILMPVIAFLFSDWFTPSFFGYLGIWYTIMTGIITIHIRLRVYRKLDQEESENTE